MLLIGLSLRESFYNNKNEIYDTDINNKTITAVLHGVRLPANAGPGMGEKIFARCSDGYQYRCANSRRKLPCNRVEYWW